MKIKGILVGTINKDTKFEIKRAIGQNCPNLESE